MALRARPRRRPLLAVASTQMNATSSRAHTIFTIILTQTSTNMETMKVPPRPPSHLSPRAAHTQEQSASERARACAASERASESVAERDPATCRPAERDRHAARPAARPHPRSGALGGPAPTHAARERGR